MVQFPITLRHLNQTFKRCIKAGGKYYLSCYWSILLQEVFYWMYRNFSFYMKQSGTSTFMFACGLR